MYISYFELVPFLKDFLVNENPRKILVISKTPSKFVKLFLGLLKSKDGSITIDKVIINEQKKQDYKGQHIYSYDSLTDESTFDCYDFVFMTDILEDSSPDVSKLILKKLLKYTIKSLLLVTPLYNTYPNEVINHQVRIYHPTLFSDFDFSCLSINTSYGALQLYSFFPQPFTVSNEKKIIGHFPNKENQLKIGYILPHKNLTGGMKCLLEQMRQLHRRGHEVYAIYKGRPGDSAIPSWSDVNVSKDISGQIIVSSQRDIENLANKVEILMCGFITVIPDYVNVKIPIVYWEQGYEGLYGDYGKLLTSNDQIRKKYQELYNLPVHFLAVADIVSDVLRGKYNLDPMLLYNGIDGNFYKPVKEKKFSSTILLVGNPALGFKNFSFGFEVLNMLWAQGLKFNVKWACQQKPNITNMTFPIELFEMPSQSELAQLYRTSDLFLFTSVYESFPMPPIEAMASGIPVIATDCGGIRTYGKGGENILLINQGDVIAFAEAVKYLINNEEARQRLIDNGLKTAKMFNFDKIAENIEDYFYSLIYPRDGEE